MLSTTLTKILYFRIAKIGAPVGYGNSMFHDWACDCPADAFEQFTLGFIIPVRSTEFYGFLADFTSAGIPPGSLVSSLPSHPVRHCRCMLSNQPSSNKNMSSHRDVWPISSAGSNLKYGFPSYSIKSCGRLVRLQLVVACPCEVGRLASPVPSDLNSGVVNTSSS